MSSKSKADDMIANKQFLQNLFNSIMSDPLPKIKKTLSESLDIYNQQYKSPTDPPLSLKALINDFKDGKGRNTLHFASSRGDKEIFCYLIENGADIQIKDSEGNPAIFIATQHSNFHLIKFIVEEMKFDITMKRQNGVTVLHIAASSGSIEMINYFLTNGCLLEDLSDFGTPLDWSVSYNHLDSVKLLISKGANLLGGSKKNKELPPPIIMAINLQYNDIAKYLIEFSYETIWCRDKSNWSTLHVASEVGNSVIIDKIIERIVTKEGPEKVKEFCDYVVNETTALDLAYQYEKWECVCILRVWTSKKNNKWEDLKQKEPSKEKPARDKEKANEKKVEGNKFFEEGKYVEALEKYSEAIELDDENSACYTNKAGCYIKLQDYQNALKLSQIAKKIDPKWIKSYFREGEAYLMMKEYGDAAASFWEGLNLEPSNKVFKDAFDHAIKCGKEQHKKAMGN